MAKILCINLVWTGSNRKQCHWIISSFIRTVYVSTTFDGCVVVTVTVRSAHWYQFHPVSFLLSLTTTQIQISRFAWPYMPVVANWCEYMTKTMVNPLQNLLKFNTAFSIFLELLSYDVN